MADYWITHTRQDGSDADRRIDAVMVNSTVYSIDQIIEWIESGAHTFWVNVRGQTVLVQVRKHMYNARKYLTTQSDGYTPNNLLNLPPC